MKTIEKENKKLKNQAPRVSKVSSPKQTSISDHCISTQFSINA